MNTDSFPPTMSIADVNNAAGVRTDDNAGSELKKLTISCTPEYKDYTFNEKHDIWGLVSLRAPSEAEEENDEKRAPIDVVAVIDKSGSMAGSKLNLVKQTLEFVLTQLDEKDRLSVVTYDTNVYLDFGLTIMNKENKEFALNKIKNIRDGSCTNLCGGLMKGLCQIIDRSPDNKNEVASMLLFTDGLANEGIRSASGIVATMKDPKRFDGPTYGETQERRQRQQVQQAPHQSWLKNVFGGKKNVTQTQPPVDMSVPENPSGGSATSTEAQASVYTFGFGADHNPEMLKEISDAGNGMYYYIENVDKIAECFGHCLGGLLSTVAQGIQLEITTVEGVVLKEVHSSRPSEKNSDKSAKISMGDLQSEESRDVVLELQIESVPAPYDTTPQVLVNARVDYFNVTTNQLESSTATLTVLRPEKAAVHDVSSSNVKVNKERARVNMTKIMKASSERAESGDLNAARDMLHQQIEHLKIAQSTVSHENADDELYEEASHGYFNMMEDLRKCSEEMVDERQYNLKGKKLQMNLYQQNVAQRSSNIDSEAYVTSRQRNKKMAAKSYVAKK